MSSAFFCCSGDRVVEDMVGSSGLCRSGGLVAWFVCGDVDERTGGSATALLLFEVLVALGTEDVLGKVSRFEMGLFGRA
jgi:hypothetical protein